MGVFLTLQVLTVASRPFDLDLYRLPGRKVDAVLHRGSKNPPVGSDRLKLVVDLSPCSPSRHQA